MERGEEKRTLRPEGWVGGRDGAENDGVCREGGEKNEEEQECRRVMVECVLQFEGNSGGVFAEVLLLLPPAEHHSEERILALRLCDVSSGVSTNIVRRKTMCEIAGFFFFINALFILDEEGVESGWSTIIY